MLLKIAASIFLVVYGVFWFFWPRTVVIREPIFTISGKSAEGNFFCRATHAASFEIQFDNEAYTPLFSGDLAIYTNNVLISEFKIANYKIANCYSGSRMAGKKRYRIVLLNETNNELQLSDVLTCNVLYRVVFSTREEIPKANFVFFCVDYRSYFQAFKRGRSK